jgi:putative transposase
MYKSYKIRLLPTKEQELKMFETINVCRFAYNFGLNYCMKYYEENKKSISGRKVRDIFTKNKEQYPWICDVSSKAYTNEFDILDKAYSDFFKKQNKAGYVKFSEKTIRKAIKQKRSLTLYDMNGHPKFKKKKDIRQSFYVRNDTLTFNQTNCTLNIERVGRVKYKSDRKIPKTKYSNPTCSFNGKYWILSFGIEVESQDIQLTNESIGIDLGIKTLATCSNKMTFGNINKSKKVINLKKKLKRLQRQCSRKYEMNKKDDKFVKTNNIVKVERVIKLLHKKLSDIRINHIHQTTNKIIKLLPRRIVLEDLNISGMMKNRHLSKAIQECMFYEFRRQIEYKAKYYGIEVVLVDRFYPSSKLCSCCGKIKKDLKLSDRMYICDCGNHIDRDYQASLNLSNYEIKTE